MARYHWINGSLEGEISRTISVDVVAIWQASRLDSPQSLTRVCSSLFKRTDVATVAVLPFEDLNADPFQPYVSQGITEDIITRLGRAGSSGFGVIAGPSVWRYRNKHPAPSQVGADLGAGYVPTGSIRRDASRISITEHLTRSRVAVQVWADSFNGPSNAALSLQEDVAAALARAMGTQIAGSAPKALERRQAIDSQAYDLYLRGRFYWNQRTKVSLKQAAEYFQQTISRAPGYAPRVCRPRRFVRCSGVRLLSRTSRGVSQGEVGVAKGA